MPDLTNTPALDVAIGLAFVCFALSLAASALQEYIANLLSLPAKVLERGLRNMLTDGTDTAGASRDLLFELYAHPLVRSLYRESWFAPGRKTLEAQAQPTDDAVEAADASETPARIENVRLPSYIAPRSFALALLDTIAPDIPATDDAGRPRQSQDIIKDIREVVGKTNLPAGVRRLLLALLDDARGDLDPFRHERRGPVRRHDGACVRLAQAQSAAHHPRHSGRAHSGAEREHAHHRRAAVARPDASSDARAAGGRHGGDDLGRHTA